jgi:HTH-type transcriptional regulator/antitoxin HipB
MTYKQEGAMGKIIRSNKDLGAAIRLVRKNMDLRQVDVAQKASVRQALVSELENGETTAKLDTVMRVLAALDLDLCIVPRRKTEFNPADY